MVRSRSTRRWLMRSGLALSLSVTALGGCRTLNAPAPLGAGLHVLALPAGSVTATASHAVSGFGPERAIDGNTGTEWGSGNVANPWLMLTLPDVYALRELNIKAYTAGGRYDVQVSEDGVSWSTALYNVTNTTWSPELKTFPVGTFGRFVRLRFDNGGRGVMVFEAALTSVPAPATGESPTPAPTATPTASPTAAATPTPTPMPTPQPTAAPTSAPAGQPGVTATYAYPGYGPSRAMDGNLNTEWATGATANTALTIDRGGYGSLTGLAIKLAPSANVYHIDVSSDGTTFQPVLSNVRNTTWGLEAKAFPAGTQARYVRLRFPGSNVMLFEVQPQGNLGATPAPTPTPAPTAAPPAGAFRTYFGNQSVPRGADNTHARGYELMDELGMTTIREGWNWKYVEEGKNRYVSWMSYFDDKADRFAQMGVKVQAMITDTPDWASSDPQYVTKTVFDAASLGKYTVPAGLHQPIFADGTDVYKPGVGPNPANYYAEYIHDMVTRFRGKIHYWQVWNEPDFPTGELTPGVYGSTGGTRYWTGSVQDYVRLLKVSHTLVKGIDPAAKITLGGLGYESYMAAIIDNGGAGYFDVVDFHAYGTDKTSSNGVLNSAWGFLGRYHAMKQVLTAKGVTGKTFACSETGFTADNQQEQASYVAKVFAAGLAAGDVEMVQWAVFTNPGHDNIGLIDRSTLSAKTLGYHAYAYATSQLSGATPSGALNVPGVQGYRFTRRDGKALYVVWSTGASASVTLPLSGGQVFDKFGAVQGASFAGGQVTLALSSSPLYVVGP